MNPVPKETREEVWRIFEEWQRNQLNRKVYTEAELEENEYEDEDNENNEEDYCPACGFPNCSGYCL